ncbi:MAG: PilT/PilU family type 4a pilus ATPase [Candidatus Omnitrophica bacterium]|nr:PilT/PilU family type 4a pilus ATPase [Candidatus Omnitrophota bacterium]
MDVNTFLKSCLDRVISQKGTDLYIKSDSKPYYRASNQLKSLDGIAVVSADDMNAIAQHLMRHTSHAEVLERERSVDLSFVVEGHGRLRANIFYQQGELSCVIRIAWKEIPSFEELRLPPVLKKWALSERGLVVISGAASSGKSTTANAMINLINENLEKHIITIEDPIEFSHVPKRSLINQREIGQDAPSFVSALRAAARQAPDVVFIGEIRDAETFASALQAAEIGRLVISTLHARSVVHVFERLLSFFPTEERTRVLMDISYHLNVIVSERLVPRQDGKGYVPAFEVLTMTATVADAVREQRFDKLVPIMQNGTADGMQTLNQSLISLKEQSLISEVEMYRASDKPQELSLKMRGFSFGNQGSNKIIGT